MAGELEEFEVGIPCPGCGHVAPKSLGWLKANDKLVCDGCGETVDLDNADFREGLRAAERSIEEFRKGLK